MERSSASIEAGYARRRTRTRGYDGPLGLRTNLDIVVISTNSTTVVLVAPLVLGTAMVGMPSPQGITSNLAMLTPVITLVATVAVSPEDTTLCNSTRTAAEPVAYFLSISNPKNRPYVNLTPWPP